MSKEILHVTLKKNFNLFSQHPEIPEYITDNLNHELRPYQEEAIQHFIYTQESDYANISFNHLLFHMATGSGKTVIMAACMLYLFKEKGYQYFLFFVNSDPIVKKTADNFTNPSSPKYLFNREGIIMDGERIMIQPVDVFPANPSENTIYLKLKTIQGLHLDLKEPKENEMTFDSLKDIKLVLLADEAHHINVETKRSYKNLSKQEIEKQNWERTVNRLLSLHPFNRLIGFTATIDLDSEALFEKYHNKIVYQYDLKSFMNEGYSKKVTLLPANEDDDRKMLHSMLLSQYRKYVAKDHGIELKPIILFKSNKIAISKKAHRNFLSMVEDLTVNQLSEEIEKGLTLYQDKSSIWNKMYNYYKNKDLSRVIRDLQWDFTKETTYNTNKSELVTSENALLLNTLEDINNPIRAIFSVDKLNEGWDVLNLFDIVRISETAKTTKTTTDSEAQLIGRGARYCPFRYQGEISYKRRFDDKPTELKVIETLHYHTINDNTYIKNLENSLDKANIQYQEDGFQYFEAKLKSKFKKTNLYKKGKVYVNQVIPTSEKDYQSLGSYNISSTFDIKYEIGTERHYGDTTIRTEIETHIVPFVPDERLWRKGIQRNRFYRFNNLSKYVPSITGINDFIKNKNFLAGVTFHVVLPKGFTMNDLNPKEKLNMVEKFLKKAAEKIRKNYMKGKGTTKFEGKSFSEMIEEHYAIEISKNQKNVHLSQIITSQNMKNKDWYVYDYAIVNGLEKQFIELMGNIMEHLNSLYDEVYLVRNEKKIKLVEFDGTRGFMPDFLLFLKDADFLYQVFLEPKGENLLKEDSWKEEFLMSLNDNPNIEILGENDSIKIIGIRFYSNQIEQKRAFKEDLAEKILKGSTENLF
jgi:type III restriction enzyme